MKKISVLLVITALLVVTGIISGCKNDNQVKKEQVNIENIDVNAFYTIMNQNKNNDKYVILDIRTPGEYNQSHLKDAILIDYYDESFPDKIGELERSKVYLVYCRSGNRSSRSMSIFKSLGFEKAYNMLGGINAWNAAGYETTLN